MQKVSPSQKAKRPTRKMFEFKGAEFRQPLKPISTDCLLSLGALKCLVALNEGLAAVIEPTWRIAG
jgi:hypothetical protein